MCYCSALLLQALGVCSLIVWPVEAVVAARQISKTFFDVLYEKSCCFLAEIFMHSMDVHEQNQCIFFPLEKLKEKNLSIQTK